MCIGLRGGDDEFLSENMDDIEHGCAPDALAAWPVEILLTPG